MTIGLRLILLLFALVGFTGAGASIAVSRHRDLTDGESDMGMLAVAVMLFIFGALCTVVATGLVGVLAFGGISLWVSYVATAQRIGLFTVQSSRLEEAATEEPRQHR
jgi:formate hydrogenlyase subunit 3/multisubunit Na+/H+ antiporter MnhD subunit